MTLPNQIQLINDLIRENREATIADYIAELRELDMTQKDKGRQRALELYAEIHKTPVISHTETTYKKAK